MMRKILTLMVILASSIGYAQDNIETLDDGVIDGIVANENTCVVGHTEDKIYLNPNRIYPTEQGVYLNLNDTDYVLLPMLNSDGNGCYVPCGRRIEVRNICPGCGRYYIAYCKNEDCPLKEKSREQEKERERRKKEYEERKKESKKK